MDSTFHSNATYPPFVEGQSKFESIEGIYGVYHIQNISFAGTPGGDFSKFFFLILLEVVFETDGIDPSKKSN